MSLPIYDSGVASGLLSGVLFGYALEGGGLTNPRKLTAQFRLVDWTVFKVMFSAVLVCAVGLWLARAVGVIGAASVYVPGTFFWATLGGGLFIGAGFALGGYCPGTSAGAAASGRLDALVFIVGMIVGTWIFAAGFEPLKPLYLAAAGPQRQTLGMLLDLPDSVVLAILIAVAAGLWQLAGRFEQARGGPIPAGDADDLDDSASHPHL